jgi:hypothetical protein
MKFSARNPRLRKYEKRCASFCKNRKRNKKVKEIIKPQKDFEMIKFVIRILLYISICLIIISCFSTLSTNTMDSYGINYFSIMTTVLILYLSVFVIIIISIYKRIKGGLVWKTIKKEVILIALTILCVMILGIITNYIAKE